MNCVLPSACATCLLPEIYFTILLQSQVNGDMFISDKNDNDNDMKKCFMGNSALIEISLKG